MLVWSRECTKVWSAFATWSESHIDAKTVGSLLEDGFDSSFLPLFKISVWVCPPLSRFVCPYRSLVKFLDQGSVNSSLYLVPSFVRFDSICCHCTIMLHGSSSCEMFTLACSIWSSAVSPSNYLCFSLNIRQATRLLSRISITQPESWLFVTVCIFMW